MIFKGFIDIKEIKLNFRSVKPQNQKHAKNTFLNTWYLQTLIFVKSWDNPSPILILLSILAIVIHLLKHPTVNPRNIYTIFPKMESFWFSVENHNHDWLSHQISSNLIKSHQISSNIPFIHYLTTNLYQLISLYAIYTSNLVNINLIIHPIIMRYMSSIQYYPISNYYPLSC